MNNIWLLALGGNLPSSIGSPLETLRAALRQLEQKGCKLIQVSPYYTTPCFPEGAGPDYINAVTQIEAVCSAEELLAQIHEVEAMFGRERQSRWAGRTLDIDLLAGGDLVLPDRQTFDHWHQLSLEKQKIEAPKNLILPHPRIQDRAFVLVPLKDVAPDWVHPVFQATVCEMLAKLPKSEVEAAVPL